MFLFGEGDSGCFCGLRIYQSGRHPRLPIIFGVHSTLPGGGGLPWWQSLTEIRIKHANGANSTFLICTSEMSFFLSQMKIMNVCETDLCHIFMSKTTSKNISVGSSQNCLFKSLLLTSGRSSRLKRLFVFVISSSLLMQILLMLT